MSRHRNVRTHRYQDEYDGYDDVYGHSLEEESCLSPGESARWMFDRGRETLTSYYEEPETEVPEAEPEPEPALEPEKLTEVDRARLSSCVEQVQDVLGDSVPEEEIVRSAVEHDFDVAKVLDRLLSSKRDTPSVTKVKPVPSYVRVDTPAESKTKPVTVVAPVINTKVKGFRVDDEEGGTDSSRLQSPVPDRKNDRKSPDPSRQPEERVKQKDRGDPVAAYNAERGDAKERLSVVVVGHVDAGKSTLMGRLLCDLGEVSQKVLHKYEQESKKMGKQSFVYAWVLDETGEERVRGITMDIGRVQFSTATKQITVLDAPGHADFIPNMISGAGQADVALLVVDATTGEFESGFDLGGQTREHAILVRSLGINQLAVAVNKLDTTNWSEDRFREICNKLKNFLKQVGFKESDITFVPLSGLTGENLVKRSTEKQLTTWYDGPCLLEVMDAFKPPPRPITKPFRMSVNDISKGVASGLAAFGKVETGTLNSGDRVLVCPTKEMGTVKSMSINDVPINVAFAGDQISVTLAGVDIQNVSVGFILCDPAKPIPISTVFEARIVVFNVKVPITKGYTVLLHHQSLIESAQVVKLKASINKSTGEVIKKKPRCLGNNSAAIVDIEVCRPICLEVYRDIKELGRVMLRVAGVTIAAGLVTAIVK